MKKLLFTLLLAAMVLPSWAYDFYIVGTAAEGWTTDRSDAYKMTNENGVFVWTGFLNAGLFKLCKDNTWNRWCASSDETTPNFGNDESTSYHESGDNNNNWILSSSGYYKITLKESEHKFRADFLVPAEDEDNCLIGTADQMEEFRKLVNEKGMSGLNAKLTANIDLSAENAHTPIGTEANKYVGTFDGGGHSIKLVINRDAGYQGLFGRATRGAKFKNLIITGSVTGQYSSAALVGEVGADKENGTIEISNVGIEASVTISGDNVGAFVGNDWGGTIKLEVDNCYHIGDITGSDYASVMGGWIDPNSTYTNVYHKGNVTQNKVSPDNAKKFAHANRGNCNNCYTTTSGDTEDGLTEGMAATKVSSGELCYNLNGTQGGTTWTQTIGTDNHPIPFNTQRLVYLNGSAYANMRFVNSEYQLSNAAELMEFSSLVNAGSSSLNAKLTTDIDMSGISYTPIGTSDHKYSGTFDGGEHRIKELKYSSTGSEKGFFSVCGAATIKNLILDSTCEFRMTEDDNGYGNAAFVGACDGSDSGTLTFQNCGNEASVISKVRNAAAFVGANKSRSNCIGIVIKDCYNTGNIGSSDTSISGNENAIICGWNANASLSVTNFYNIGEIGQIDGNKNLERNGGSSTTSFTNCYNLTSQGNQGESLGSPAETSGKLCYKLAHGATPGTWTQTIGTDNHPIPFSTSQEVNEVVEGVSYTNLDITSSIVQLATADELEQFAKEVNAGNTALGAKLTANITASEDFTPIGNNSRRYTGEFDGNFKSIELAIDSDEDYQGLFGVITGGAYIHDVTVTGSVTGQDYVAGVVASVKGNSGEVNIYDCKNTATITGRNNVAGILGLTFNEDGYCSTNIQYCCNTGNVSGTSDNGSALICAWLGKGTIKHTFASGSITGNEFGKDFVRYQDDVTPYANVIMTTSSNILGAANYNDEDATYTISNVDKFLTIATMVNVGGKTTKNFTLDADIDLTGRQFTPIGTATYMYKGTFDGGGKKVTLDIDESGTEHQGLFGHATGGATFKNLIIGGTVNCGANSAALIGEAGGAGETGTITISKVGCEADVTGSGNNVGAFVGNNWDGTIKLQVENSYNIGDISCSNYSTVMGFWTDGSSTFKNVYNIGPLSVTADSAPVYQFIVCKDGTGSGTLTNCYTQESKSSTVVTGGELCAKLGYAFHQSAEDTYPNLNTTHDFVTKMSSVGYTTQYISESAVTIPSDVTAYAGEINDTWLRLDPIVGTIPKGEPVILKGTANTIYRFAPTTDVDRVTNDLKGSDGDITGNGSSIYALANLGDPAVVGFYLVNDGVPVPAGKAYLNTDAEVKGFTFLFDDDATAIEMVNGQSSMVNEIYNLAGQRINKVQKGINIVNGKKVMK